jgi:copper chaperone CopZ
VRGQLKRVPGVLDADVDFENGTATVTVIEGTPAESVAAGLSGQYSGTVR